MTSCPGTRSRTHEPGDRSGHKRPFGSDRPRDGHEKTLIRAERRRSVTTHGRTSARSAVDKPWANSRFWLLQLIILALYLIRLAASVAFHLDSRSLVVELSTLALFLVPVVYAALNYGIHGSDVHRRLGHASGRSPIPVRGLGSQRHGRVGRARPSRPTRFPGLPRGSARHRRTRCPPDRRVGPGGASKCRSPLSRSIRLQPFTNPHRRRKWQRRRGQRIGTSGIHRNQFRNPLRGRAGTIGGRADPTGRHGRTGCIWSPTDHAPLGAVAPNEGRNGTSVRTPSEWNRSPSRAQGIPSCTGRRRPCWGGPRAGPGCRSYSRT